MALVSSVAACGPSTEDVDEEWAVGTWHLRDESCVELPCEQTMAAHMLELREGGEARWRTEATCNQPPEGVQDTFVWSGLTRDVIELSPEAGEVTLSWHGVDVGEGVTLRLHDDCVAVASSINGESRWFRGEVSFFADAQGCSGTVSAATDEARMCAREP